MFLLVHSPGRNTFIENKEFLFFSGYAYLSMNQHPDFIKFVKEGMDLYGPLFPSSRISNTALELYNETELLLTKRTQLTDTILLPSGFTAGRAAVEWINSSSNSNKPQIFHSPFCHPAIRIGNNAIIPFDEWASETVIYINSNEFDNPPVILSDSLNQLTAELYDFSFLNQIEQKIVCIIDDSHGIGLIGNAGAGISSYLPKKDNIEYIISYSMSKALNIPAGAISCSSKLRANDIRSSHWYTAVTPPSPALLYAFGKSAAIYQNQLAQLKKQKKKLQELVVDNPAITFHPDLPVYILPEKLDEDYFAQKNIIISSFAYPTATGKKINRAVLNALHTDADIEALANAIAL